MIIYEHFAHIFLCTQYCRRARGRGSQSRILLLLQHNHCIYRDFQIDLNNTL